MQDLETGISEATFRLTRMQSENLDGLRREFDC